ncbi:ABC transporter ATP-binding protein [Christiangramia fulva]|uniref:ABC transporter ATP-binding protein n=1 Tax=Christiangramia fulva TaxID=2126553 RepID=A0A2R3Z6Y0_9FLAO|nr:DUF4435 domain-containing protein [Christiangramia fulva]AVR46047.1 ABC transporter ATP-binding protein [Christiangramia fulva]
MQQKINLIKSIESGLSRFNNQLNFSKKVDSDAEIIILHEDLIKHYELLKNLLENGDFSINHINQFQNELNTILQYIPVRSENYEFNDVEKVALNRQIETAAKNIQSQFELIKFNFAFFETLGFLKENIVAIGANGSGKTTLSNELKKYLPNNGVVISAQKVLIIPTFSGISNFVQTNQKLKNTQVADKSLRTTFSTANDGNAYSILKQIGGEFQILLDNLLAERSAIRNKFCDNLNDGGNNTTVPVTKLDKTLFIWNSLIEHREISCSDGINITLSSHGVNSYPAHQMSDGEKVALYHIAQVLQAPESGFIVVDEPEMYLHKTILNKLWDILEKERQDCIFVYLTHDLDFATRRTTAKKVWIKSFKHPNRWEIENIPSNALPESLLLELLGSRKNILFCEGQKGSIDEKIYNTLFPNFTITPVESCFSVINYTKAFNKIQSRTVKAYGIIDSDHHSSDRLDKLKEKGVFSISVSEIENLFFEKEFLKFLANQILKDESDVQRIQQEIIKQFQKDLELQISNYLSTKINYYYKDSDMSKGNTLDDVRENYNKFLSEIKIPEWYKQRKLEMEDLIQQENYEKIISVYNNKGLKKIANKNFNISDFIERSIKAIQFNPSVHQILLKKFPEELVQKNGL